MPRKRHKGSNGKNDLYTQNYWEGTSLVCHHAIFAPMYSHASIDGATGLCPGTGLAIVTSNGHIHVHPSRIIQPAEWAYVLAHCLLHLAFGHFQAQYKHTLREWNAACDCFIAKFLADLKFGSPPLELKGLLDDLSMAGFSIRSEEHLYEEFCLRGIPEHLLPTGTAGEENRDMIYDPRPDVQRDKLDWQQCFSEGLQVAVTSAVDLVGGLSYTAIQQVSKHNTEAYRAKNWFITNYPLLGALAASFAIIEDQLICHRMQISIAAVDMEAKEIYLNPQAGLSQQELRFVMAHELLHVGLRHDVRCGGRDPYLWNVACDYVINGWLIEMGVGEIPAMGALYDPDLKGESAEAIYDRIVNDLRRYRKSMTLRGTAMGDILGKSGWWAIGEGVDLDEFYRNCLSQGLLLHQEQGRGYLAAGLIEEIRALSQPPIPWDIELAQWFDHYFPPIEKVRSYARLSRRQSTTPDIPRPLWVPPPNTDNARTFGVLLDTSGSMDRTLLAKALGAIASYSMSRDVPAVRVVFCDAVTYDQGYMAPEAIAERVQVRGRGGTILQPGIDLLERAEDFPSDGPLLIITDGLCDKLYFHREHAFLLPEGRNLPFIPKGKVFRLK